MTIAVEVPVVADTRPAERGIRRVIEKAKQGVKTSLTVNTEQAEAKLIKLKKTAKDISQNVVIRGDTKSLQDKFRSFKTQINKPLLVRVDTSNTQSGLNKIRNNIKSIGKERILIKGDTSKLYSELQKVRSQTNKGQVIKIHGDTSKLYSELQKTFAQVNKKRVIQIHGDTSNLSSKLQKVRAETTKGQIIRVKGNTSDIDSKITNIRTRFNRFRNDAGKFIRVNVDTSAAEPKIDKLTRSLQRTNLESKKLQTANLSKPVKGMQDLNTNVSMMNRSLSGSVRSMQRLAATAGGIYALVTAMRTLVKSSDRVVDATNKLALVSGTKNATSELNELYDISNKTSASLAATIETYFRFGQALGDKTNTKELKEVAETINKALAIGGSTGQSGRAAIFQLGQGLAAEALRGQELNSVLEQTPRIAKIIADHLGVGVGKLRALAEQGKLTSKVILDAVKSQADQIDKEFSRIEFTISSRFVVMGDAFGRYLARIMKETNFSGFIKRQLDSLTDYFNASAPAHTKFIKKFTDTMTIAITLIKLLGQVVSYTFREVINRTFVQGFVPFSLFERALYSFYKTTRIWGKSIEEMIGRPFRYIKFDKLGLLETRLYNMFAARHDMNKFKKEAESVSEVFTGMNEGIRFIPARIRRATAEAQLLANMTLQGWDPSIIRRFLGGWFAVSNSIGQIFEPFSIVGAAVGRAIDNALVDIVSAIIAYFRILRMQIAYEVGRLNGYIGSLFKGIVAKPIKLIDSTMEIIIPESIKSGLKSQLSSLFSSLKSISSDALSGMVSIGKKIIEIIKIIIDNIVDVFSSIDFSKIKNKIAGLVNSLKGLMSSFRKIIAGRSGRSSNIFGSMFDSISKIKFSKNILSPIIDTFEKFKKYLYKLKSNISSASDEFEVFSNLKSKFKSISNSIRPISSHINKLSDATDMFAEYLDKVYSSAKSIGTLPTLLLLLTSGILEVGESFNKAAISLLNFVNNIPVLDRVKRSISDVVNALRSGQGASESFKEFSDNLNNMSFAQASIRLIISLIEDLINSIKAAGSKIGSFVSHLTQLSDISTNKTSRSLGNLVDSLRQVSDSLDKIDLNFNLDSTGNNVSDLASDLADKLEGLKTVLDRKPTDIPVRFRISSVYDAQLEEEISNKLKVAVLKIREFAVPVIVSNLVLRLDVGTDGFKESLELLKFNIALLKTAIVSYADLAPIRAVVKMIGAEFGRVFKDMIDNATLATNSIFGLITDLVSGASSNFGILGSVIEKVVSWFPIIGIPLLIAGFNIITLRLSAVRQLWLNLGAASQWAMGVMHGNNARLYAGMVAGLGVTQALTSEHMSLSTALFYAATTLALYNGNFLVSVKDTKAGTGVQKFFGTALKKSEKYTIELGTALILLGSHLKSLAKRFLALSVVTSVVNGLKIAFTTLTSRVVALQVATSIVNALTASTVRLGVAANKAGLSFGNIGKRKFLVGAAAMTTALLLAGTAFASTGDEVDSLNSRLFEFSIVAATAATAVGSIAFIIQKTGLGALLTGMATGIITGITAIFTGSISTIKGMLSNLYLHLATSPLIAKVIAFFVSPLGVALTAITAVVGSIAAVYINHRIFMNGLFEDVYTNGKFYADRLEGIAKNIKTTFSKENLSLVEPYLGEIRGPDGGVINLGDISTDIEDMNLSGLSKPTVDAISEQSAKLSKLMKSNVETIKSEGKLSRWETWKTTRAVKELKGSIEGDAKEVDLNTLALQLSLQGIRELAKAGVNRGSIHDKYNVGVSRDFEQLSSELPISAWWSGINPFNRQQEVHPLDGFTISDLEAAINAGNYKIPRMIASDLRSLGSDDPFIRQSINVLETVARAQEAAANRLTTDKAGNTDLLKDISTLSEAMNTMSNLGIGQDRGADAPRRTRMDIVDALNEVGQSDLGDLVDKLGNFDSDLDVDALKQTIDKVGTGNWFSQTRGDRGLVGGATNWISNLLAGVGITQDRSELEDEVNNFIDTLVGIDLEKESLRLTTLHKRMIEIREAPAERFRTGMEGYDELIKGKFDAENFLSLLPGEQETFGNLNDILKSSGNELVDTINARLGTTEYPFLPGESGLLSLDTDNIAFEVGNNLERLKFQSLSEAAKTINEGSFRLPTAISLLNNTLDNADIGINLSGINEDSLDSLVGLKDEYIAIKANLVPELDPQSREKLQEKLKDIEWDLKDLDTNQLDRIAYKAEELGVEVSIRPVWGEDDNFLDNIENQLNNLKDVEIGSDDWYIHSAALEVSLTSASDLLSGIADMDTAVDLGDLIDGAKNVGPLVGQFTLLTAARKKFNDLSAADILDPKALKEAYDNVKNLEKSLADATRQFGSFGARFSEATSALGVSLDPSQIQNFSDEALEALLSLGETKKDLDEAFKDADSVEAFRAAAIDIVQSSQDTADVLRTQRTAIQALDDMSSQFGINMEEVFIYGTREVVEELLVMEQQMFELQKAIRAAADANNWEEFQALQEQLRNLQIEGQKLANQEPFWHSWLEGMQSSFSNAFYDILTGAKSFSDGIKDLFDDIAKHIVRKFSEDVGNAIYSALTSAITGVQQQGNWINDMIGGFAGGGGGGGGGSKVSTLVTAASLGYKAGKAFGWWGGDDDDSSWFAEGGPVYGPGGPTDDAIPAWLSNGEFVINARATKKHRPLLEQINAYKDGGIVGTGGMLTISDDILKRMLETVISESSSSNTALSITNFNEDLLEAISNLGTIIETEFGKLTEKLVQGVEILTVAIDGMAGGISSGNTTSPWENLIDDINDGTEIVPTTDNPYPGTGYVTPTEEDMKDWTVEDYKANVEAAKKHAEAVSAQVASAKQAGTYTTPTETSDSADIESAKKSAETAAQKAETAAVEAAGSQSYSSDDSQNNVIRTYTDIPKATSISNTPTSEGIVINNLQVSDAVASEVVDSNKLEPTNMQVDKYESIKSRMENLESRVDQDARRDRITEELYGFINSNERAQIALYDAIVALDKFGPMDARVGSRAFTDDPSRIPFYSQEEQQQDVYDGIIEGFNSIKDDLYRQGLDLNIEDAIHHVTSGRAGIEELLSSNKDDVVDALARAQTALQVEVYSPQRPGALNKQDPLAAGYMATVEIPELTIDMIDARSAELSTLESIEENLRVIPEAIEKLGSRPDPVFDEVSGVLDDFTPEEFYPTGIDRQYWKNPFARDEGVISRRHGPTDDTSGQVRRNARTGGYGRWGSSESPITGDEISDGIANVLGEDKYKPPMTPEAVVYGPSEMMDPPSYTSGMVESMSILDIADIASLAGLAGLGAVKLGRTIGKGISHTLGRGGLDNVVDLTKIDRSLTGASIDVPGDVLDFPIRTLEDRMNAVLSRHTTYTPDPDRAVMKDNMALYQAIKDQVEDKGDLTFSGPRTEGNIVRLPETWHDEGAAEDLLNTSRDRLSFHELNLKELLDKDTARTGGHSNVETLQTGEILYEVDNIKFNEMKIAESKKELESLLNPKDNVFEISDFRADNLEELDPNWLTNFPKTPGLDIRPMQQQQAHTKIPDDKEIAKSVVSLRDKMKEGASLVGRGILSFGNKIKEDAKDSYKEIKKTIDENNRRLAIEKDRRATERLAAPKKTPKLKFDKDFDGVPLEFYDQEIKLTKAETVKTTDMEMRPMQQQQAHTKIPDPVNKAVKTFKERLTGATNTVANAGVNTGKVILAFGNKIKETTGNVKHTFGTQKTPSSLPDLPADDLRELKAKREKYYAEEDEYYKGRNFSPEKEKAQRHKMALIDKADRIYNLKTQEDLLNQLKMGGGRPEEIEDISKDIAIRKHTLYLEDVRNKKVFGKRGADNVRKDAGQIARVNLEKRAMESVEIEGLSDGIEGLLKLQTPSIAKELSAIPLRFEREAGKYATTDQINSLAETTSIFIREFDSANLGPKDVDKLKFLKDTKSYNVSLSELMNEISTYENMKRKLYFRGEDKTDPDAYIKRADHIGFGEEFKHIFGSDMEISPPSEFTQFRFTENMVKRLQKASEADDISSYSLYGSGVHGRGFDKFDYRSDIDASYWKPITMDNVKLDNELTHQFQRDMDVTSPPEKLSTLGANFFNESKNRAKLTVVDPDRGFVLGETFENSMKELGSKLSNFPGTLPVGAGVAVGAGALTGIPTTSDAFNIDDFHPTGIDTQYYKDPTTGVRSGTIPQEEPPKRGFWERLGFSSDPEPAPDVSEVTDGVAGVLKDAQVEFDTSWLPSLKQVTGALGGLVVSQAEAATTSGLSADTRVKAAKDTTVEKLEIALKPYLEDIENRNNLETGTLWKTLYKESNLITAPNIYSTDSRRPSLETSAMGPWQIQLDFAEDAAEIGIILQEEVDNVRFGKTFNDIILGAEVTGGMMSRRINEVHKGLGGDLTGVSDAAVGYGVHNQGAAGFLEIAKAFKEDPNTPITELSGARQTKIKNQNRNIETVGQFMTWIEDGLAAAPSFLPDQSDIRIAAAEEPTVEQPAVGATSSGAQLLSVWSGISDRLQDVVAEVIESSESTSTFPFDDYNLSLDDFGQKSLDDIVKGIGYVSKEIKELPHSLNWEPSIEVGDELRKAVGRGRGPVSYDPDGLRPLVDYKREGDQLVPSPRPNEMPMYEPESAGFWEKLGSNAESMIDSFSNGFANALDKVKGASDKVIDSLPSSVTEERPGFDFEVFKDQFSDAVDGAGDMINKFSERFADAADTVKDAIPDWIGSLPSTPPPGTDAVTEVLANVVDTPQLDSSDLLPDSSIVDIIVGPISDALDAVRDAIEEPRTKLEHPMVGAEYDALQNAIENIQPEPPTFTNPIVDPVLAWDPGPIPEDPPLEGWGALEVATAVAPILRPLTAATRLGEQAIKQAVRIYSQGRVDRKPQEKLDAASNTESLVSTVDKIRTIPAEIAKAMARATGRGARPQPTGTALVPYTPKVTGRPSTVGSLPAARPQSTGWGGRPSTVGSLPAARPQSTGWGGRPSTVGSLPAARPQSTGWGGRPSTVGSLPAARPQSTGWGGRPSTVGSLPAARPQSTGWGGRPSTVGSLPAARPQSTSLVPYNPRLHGPWAKGGIGGGRATGGGIGTTPGTSLVPYNPRLNNIPTGAIPSAVKTGTAVSSDFLAGMDSLLNQLDQTTGAIGAVGEIFLGLPPGPFDPNAPTTQTVAPTGLPTVGEHPPPTGPRRATVRAAAPAPQIDPTFANLYQYAREPGPETPSSLARTGIYHGTKMMAGMAGFGGPVSGAILGAMGLNKETLTMAPTFNLGQALDTSAEKLMMAQTKTTGYRDQQDERAGNYRTVGEVNRFRGGNQFVKEHKDGSIQRITNIAGERIYETFKDAADYQKGVLHSITGHESLTDKDILEVVQKSGTRMFGNIKSLSDSPALESVADSLNNIRGAKEIKGTDLTKDLVDATGILNQKLGVDYKTPGAGVSQVIEEDDKGIDLADAALGLLSGDSSPIGLVAEGVKLLSDQNNQAIETEVAGTEDLKDAVNTTGQDALNAQRDGTNAVTGALGDSSNLLEGAVTSNGVVVEGAVTNNGVVVGGAVTTSGLGVQGAVINSGNLLKGAITTGMNLLAGGINAVRNAVKPPVVEISYPGDDPQNDRDDDRDDDGGGGGGGDDQYDRDDDDSGGGSSGGSGSSGGGTQDQRDEQRDRQERQERQSDFTNVGTNPKDRGTTSTSTTSTRTSSPSPGSAGPNYGGTGSTSGGMATGGMVYGPGGPTGDKIPAMLSAGEFVVNARSAKIHRPTLEKINKYKDGGSVGENDYINMGQGGDSFSLMIETITKAMRPEDGLYDKFIETMESSDDAAKESTSQIVDELILIGAGIKESIRESKDSLKDAISSSIDNMVEKVVAGLSSIKSSIDSLGSSLSSSLSSIQSSISSSSIYNPSTYSSSSISSPSTGTSTNTSNSELTQEEIEAQEAVSKANELYSKISTPTSSSTAIDPDLPEYIRLKEKKKQDEVEKETASGTLSADGRLWLNSYMKVMDRKMKERYPDYTPIKLEYATGGMVSGPGGPTGDKIPAMLSSGEFVINARATKIHRPLLEKINKYKDGGIVGDQNSETTNQNDDSFSLMIETITKAVRPESELYNAFIEAMEVSDDLFKESTDKICDEIILLGAGVKDTIKESSTSLAEDIKSAMSKSDEARDESFKNFISEIKNIADVVIKELGYIRSSLDSLNTNLSSFLNYTQSLISANNTDSDINTDSTTRVSSSVSSDTTIDPELPEYIKLKEKQKQEEIEKETASGTLSADGRLWLNSYMKVMDKKMKEKYPDYTPIKLQYATGGMVSGPGGPTGDKIPAMISSGEFVVNAASTKNYLPLLNGINNGTLDVPKMMAGGLVSGNWMRDMKGYMMSSSHTIPSSDTPSSIHQSSALQSNNAIQNKPGASQTVVNLGVVGDVTEKTVEVVYGMLPEIARAVAQVNRERGYT